MDLKKEWMKLTKEKLINLIKQLISSNNNSDDYLFTKYEIKDSEFSFTNETNKYFNTPDMQSFINLLNNYNSNMKESDNYTDEENKEIDKFLCKLSEKDFFKYICTEISTEIDIFRKFIRDNLFNLTSVGKNNNTCAFEHIFLGEFKDDNEKGFHNWIQFYSNKDLIKNFNLINQIKFDKLSIVDFGMIYDGKTKPRCSMIFGIHPMIEICIYTLIYIYAYSNGHKELKFDFDDSIGFQLYTVNNGESFRTCYPFIKKTPPNNLPPNNLPPNNLPPNNLPPNNLPPNNLPPNNLPPNNLPPNNLPSNNTKQVKNELETKLAETELKLAETELKLTKTKTKLAETELKLTKTETKLAETELKLTKTKTKLTEIKLILF